MEAAGVGGSLERKSLGTVDPYLGNQSLDQGLALGRSSGFKRFSERGDDLLKPTFTDLEAGLSCRRLLKLRGSAAEFVDPLRQRADRSAQSWADVVPASNARKSLSRASSVRASSARAAASRSATCGWLSALRAAASAKALRTKSASL
jgi:hypothetical protein